MQLCKLDRELDSYIESMVAGMGRAARRRAMELYVTGLLLDGVGPHMEPEEPLQLEPSDLRNLRGVELLPMFIDRAPQVLASRVVLVVR